MMSATASPPARRCDSVGPAGAPCVHALTRPQTSRTQEEGPPGAGCASVCTRGRVLASVVCAVRALALLKLSDRRQPAHADTTAVLIKKIQLVLRICNYRSSPSDPGLVSKNLKTGKGSGVGEKKEPPPLLHESRPRMRAFNCKQCNCSRARDSGVSGVSGARRGRRAMVLDVHGDLRLDVLPRATLLCAHCPG